MASARPEETELLRRLYANASAAPAQFGALLEHLATLTRAEAAALRGGPAERWERAGPRGGADEPLDQPEVARWLDSLRAERVYDGEDLRAVGALLPDQRLRALRVRLGPEGDSAWLAILRRGEDFRAIDAVTLGALAPHLPQAMSTARRLTAERRAAARHQTIAARLGAGWIEVDPTGRVSDHDAAAARLLAGAGLRLERGQRLAGADAALDARLAEALRAPPRAVLLRATPPLGLVLTRDGAAITGYLQAPAAAPVAPARVQQMWGLTRAEARLALALTRGHSLSEAAAALGLTVETARSYSRAIFARTGWRGQPDLIRATLTSALWLGPPQDAP